MYKYRIKNILFKIIYISFMSLFIFICTFIFNGLLEKGVVNNEIDNFKNRGEFIKEIVIDNQTVKVYNVKAEFDYELLDKRTVYDIDNPYIIGSKGDIVLTTRNPLNRYSAFIRDVVGIFSENFFCGHATMNVTDDGSQVIESVGNDKDLNGVRLNENNWIETEIRQGASTKIFIGLRLKYIDDDILNQYVDDLLSKVGLDYNMNFFIPKRNAYYCTDLLTRVGNNFGFHLNYDSFFATGNDILVSDDTYITFICEKTDDASYNIYYLGDE